MYTIVSINDMGHLRCSYISHTLKVAILTHCFLMDCPIHVVAIGMGLYVVTGRIVFLTLNVVLISANGADPDEIQHDAAFHQSLHCLQRTHLGISGTKG